MSELEMVVAEAVTSWSKGESIVNDDIKMVLDIIDDLVEDDAKTITKEHKKAFFDGLKDNSSAYTKHMEGVFNCVLNTLEDQSFQVLRGARVSKLKKAYFDNISDTEEIGKYLKTAFDGIDVLNAAFKNRKSAELIPWDDLDRFCMLLIHFVFNETYVEKLPDFLFNLHPDQINTESRSLTIKRKGKKLEIHISEDSHLMLEEYLRGKNPINFHKLQIEGNKSKIPKEIWDEMTSWFFEWARMEKWHIKDFFARSYKIYKIYFGLPLEVAANLSGLKYGYIAIDSLSTDSFVNGGLPKEEVDKNNDDFSERDLQQMETRLKFNAIYQVDQNAKIIDQTRAHLNKFMSISEVKPKVAKRASAAKKFKEYLDKSLQYSYNCSLSFTGLILLYYLQGQACFLSPASIKKYFNVFYNLLVVKTFEKDLKEFEQEDWEDFGKCLCRQFKIDYRYKFVDFVTWLKENSYISKDAFDKADFLANSYVKVEDKQPACQALFGPDEIKSIFDKLKAEEDKTALWLFCLGLCGLRAEECLLLGLDSVGSVFMAGDDLTTLNLRVWSSKSRNGSGRNIPVHALLPPEIFRYFAKMVKVRVEDLRRIFEDNKKFKGELLIPFDMSEWNLEDFSSDDKDKLLNKVFSKVRAAVKLRGDLKFHTLRHYTITCILVRLIEFIIDKPIQKYEDEDWLSVPRSQLKRLIGYSSNEDLLRIHAKRNLFSIGTLIAGHGNTATTAQVYMNMMPLIIYALRTHEQPKPDLWFPGFMQTA